MTDVRRLSRVCVTCLVAAIVLSSTARAEDGYTQGVLQPEATPPEAVNQTRLMAWDDAFGVPTPLPPLGPELAEAVQGGRDGHRLAVYYVIPSDLTYEPALFNRLVTASLDIQSWYQCATGGLTWTFDYPEIVRVYYALQTHNYYKANGDWWGSLLPEMEARGYPIWESGTVTALLARGAGWWAGGAQWCGGECGVVILGAECFPEFNDPAFSGGECPGGHGVYAWPCTPEGAYAHELGHTLGLPHPIDNPPTASYAYHSIMQTHWNYPDWASPSQSPWGFLTLERAAIQASPFLSAGVDLRQAHEGCDVVNLPPNGPAPMAQFSYSATGLDVQFTNLSTGAVRHYWSFGDSTVSNDVNPIHTFDAPDLYIVRLRCSAANAMMSKSQVSVDLRLPGACCSNGGACEITLPAVCVSPSRWHGEWTTCDPNPCPQPGVCCTSAGVCAITLQADCLLPSMWHGDWTGCEPNPCPQPPTGACCYPDGLCGVLTEAQCNGVGAYHGDNMLCVPNPCPQPGVCCTSAGMCAIALQANCLLPSTWHGDWTGCEPNPCPQPPTGACCYPNGACYLLTQVLCSPQTYLGDGSSCSPNPCPQPQLKACCNPATGDCTLTVEYECLSPSVWHWEWSSCTPDLCPTSDVPTIADGLAEGFIGGIPNPFESFTTFWYRLSRKGQVNLEIFDAGGHRVQALDLGEMGPGVHSMDWDGRDSRGASVTSGVLFVRLSSGGQVWTKALIRVK